MDTAGVWKVHCFFFFFLVFAHLFEKKKSGYPAPAAALADRCTLSGTNTTQSDEISTTILNFIVSLFFFHITHVGIIGSSNIYYHDGPKLALSSLLWESLNLN